MSSPIPGPGRAVSVLFALIGVAGLLLVRFYSGPGRTAVHSYCGNVAASFAAYFVLSNLPLRKGTVRLLTAGLALAAAELFEALDGFGVMTNVYDPADFAANAAGVALALAVDTAAGRIRFIRRNPANREQGKPRR